MIRTRYPNQFGVAGTGSPNILRIRNIPRALARTHAIQLASWLVAYAGDMPEFLKTLIDVWASRYGEAQVPVWLFGEVPDWAPWDPQAAAPRRMPPPKQRPAPLPKEGAVRAQSQPTVSGGETVTAIVGADGEALTGDDLAKIAEANREAILARKAASDAASSAKAAGAAPESGNGVVPMPPPIASLNRGAARDVGED